MSDVFEGPGYWMASDGKWYPPERHPDPAYRAQFEPAPVVQLDPSDVVDRGPEPSLDGGDPEGSLESGDIGGAEEKLDPASLRPPAIPPDATSASAQSGEVDVSTDASDSAGANEVSGATDAGEADVAEFPTVELRSDPANELRSTASTALFDIHHVAASDETEIGDEPDEDHAPSGAPTEDEPRIAATEPAVARSESVRHDAPSFSVAKSDFAPATERPVFDVTPPRSIAGAPTREERSGSGIELELDWEPAAHRATPDGAGTSAELSTSTALVVIPSSSHTTVQVSLFDRLLAAIIFCSGVAMIVGTFLEWTTGSLTQTGWERGDGIATIIAGVVGSATAGPIYVGFQHIAPKSIAVICGLIGLVVVGLSAASVLFDEVAAGTSTGVGFIVVLVGAASMTIAGLAHRVDLLY